MRLAKDEVRVLRDAYRLHRMGTDYSETEAWERPIVDRLVAEGLLEISIVGQILDERSFRPTRAGMARAAECYHAFESDLAILRMEVAAGLLGAPPDATT